jgi:hydroxymethylbilane synthase
MTRGTTTTLRLGTRGSDLARTQATTVADALRAAGNDVELTIIKTAGDRDQTGAFGSIGPQGVFVREIETALVERRIELAVHSFKDLPTTSPSELVIGAVPKRVDPADLLLVRTDKLAGSTLDWLPLAVAARVGTASARRRVWLRHFRPDLEIQPLRGNVPTRIRKLREEHLDAIVLAAAGVERLLETASLEGALDGVTVLRLDPQRFVPAPAQGALAVQCRLDDARVREVLAALDHAGSRAAVEAERDALRRAEGGCDVAFGAYFMSGDTDAGRRPGALHELLGMHERAGRVRAARVRGTDASKLGADLWAKLDAGRGDAR